MKVVRRVRPQNSTVNGRTVVPYHDARDWLNGWKNLNFNDKRVYKDGKPGDDKDLGPNIFGYGRKKGFSCGEYLHVPLSGDEQERRWYRVRSRLEPGMKYKGKRILSVRASKICGHWHWVYSLEEKRRNDGNRSKAK